jgi:hypothetical protein
MQPITNLTMFRFMQRVHEQKGQLTGISLKHAYVLSHSLALLHGFQHPRESWEAEFKFKFVEQSQGGNSYGSRTEF